MSFFPHYKPFLKKTNFFSRSFSQKRYRSGNLDIWYSDNIALFSHVKLSNIKVFFFSYFYIFKTKFAVFLDISFYLSFIIYNNLPAFYYLHMFHTIQDYNPHTLHIFHNPFIQCLQFIR